MSEEKSIILMMMTVVLINTICVEGMGIGLEEYNFDDDDGSFD